MSELARLTSEITRFCQQHALGGGVEFDLNQVLEELFTNAVRHGGCAGMPGAARVELGAQANGVAIEYADRGTPFDPTMAPAPDVNAPLEARQPGGLGIHLVRRIVRDLRYERVDGWNRLTMLRPATDGEK